MKHIIGIALVALLGCGGEDVHEVVDRDMAGIEQGFSASLLRRIEENKQVQCKRMVECWDSHQFDTLEHCLEWMNGFDFVTFPLECFQPNDVIAECFKKIETMDCWDPLWTGGVGACLLKTKGCQGF